MDMVNVSKIHKKYKNGVEALKSVSFTVAEGEFVSVIGPSGAGKTSLIRMLNGAMKPTTGDVFLSFHNSTEMNGKLQPFNQMKGRQKRKMQQQIGTIYQNFCLVDHLNCLQNVLNAELTQMNTVCALFGIFSKEQKERALKALEDVGLQDKADIPASQLSGGQKQRVAIARSLMQKPQLLLADEPVASLDPYTSEQILQLIQKIQKDYHLTVLMNSHNVEAALKYSDRIIGIRNGIVVLDQKTENVGKEELNLVYGTQEKQGEVYEER